MEWLGVVGTISSLVVLGFNVAMFVVIKFNDFAHMEKKQVEMEKANEKNFDELKRTLKDQDKKIDNIAERVAAIEGTCKAVCLNK